MAIQNRYGDYSDFVPSKMLPAELAFVVSGDTTTKTGKSVRACFSPGDVQKLVTEEEMRYEVQALIADSSVVTAAAQQGAADYLEEHPEIAITLHDDEVTENYLSPAVREKLGMIQNLLGDMAVIDTSPVTAVHALGSYIIWEGKLYKCLKAIGVGATLEPGNNISLTNAGAELASLASLVAKNTTDIAANAGNITTNANAISSLNTKLSLLNYYSNADGFNNNFLYVSTGSRDGACNRRCSWSWTSGTKSNYRNIPTALMGEEVAVGVREVYYNSEINILVKVTELYPKHGRIHYNFYNNGSWTGWSVASTDENGKYSVVGKIATSISGKGTAVGTGRVIINVTNRTVEFQFLCKITTAGTKSNVYDFGISIDNLRSINSSIPEMTINNGGLIEYYTSSGGLDVSMTGYAGVGSVNTTNNYISFARVYSEDGDVGAWPDSKYTNGTFITGTFYASLD